MKRPAPQPIVWYRKPSVLTRYESPASLALESIRQCGEENRYARFRKDEVDKNTHFFAIKYRKYEKEHGALDSAARERTED